MVYICCSYFKLFGSSNLQVYQYSKNNNLFGSKDMSSMCSDSRSAFLSLVFYESAVF